MLSRTFWEYLGVLKYVQAKYSEDKLPDMIWRPQGPWHMVDEKLYKDFPDDYTRVRALQRLHGTTKIPYIQEDTAI